MSQERIEKYFQGVAWKYLSGVDVFPHGSGRVSNQHEFGGLVKAGFGKFLGDPGSGVFRFKTKFIYFVEDEGKSASCESEVIWYDSRRRNPSRKPELRLYYKKNPVLPEMKQGDFFLIAKKHDNSLLVVVSPPGSSEEKKLRWLFGLDETEEVFAGKEISSNTFRDSFSTRWILEEIEIDPDLPSEKDHWLDILNKKFGDTFPSTKIFSETARVLSKVSLNDDTVDRVLVEWLETEEILFRMFEKYQVENRLKERFVSVEDFFSYSLSVQNRRKSRAGYSLENHLEFMFQSRDIFFKRGARTENRSKPDFLFPGEEEYHDQEFPEELLTVLGAKSSCKERWRQVLSEAKRAKNKHLITLEPAISENQTNEMRASYLQLVIPFSLHQTFSANQQKWLWDVDSFFSFVLKKQRQLQV